MDSHFCIVIWSRLLDVREIPVKISVIDARSWYVKVSHYDFDFPQPFEGWSMLYPYMCTLNEFWTLDLINWTLPAPGLKWGFFLNRKEISTSKAQRGWQGSISLISPVFRDWNKACTSSAESYSKAYQPEIFAFLDYHHPPFNLYLIIRLGNLASICK